MNYTILRESGIDVETGLARCLNDREFYEQFLMMFLEDTSFERARAAFEQKDYKELFKCAHELKGVSGNAGLSELYDAVSPLVDLVRGGSADDGEAAALFERVSEAYERARDGVARATEG